AASILKNKGYQNTISNIMLLRLEKIIKRSEYEILKAKSILF
ncbi:site-specific DNA-methyltransferase, partial [Helicobacter pylori]|nr:site-specific DNA-methyltransferase [Helicobacter pylori]